MLVIYPLEYYPPEPGPGGGWRFNGGWAGEVEDTFIGQKYLLRISESSHPHTGLADYLRWEITKRLPLRLHGEDRTWVLDALMRYL